ncbi:MAG: GDSL-type esterase/lipase family protein [Balneolaceae bacterium]
MKPTPFPLFAICWPLLFLFMLTPSMTWATADSPDKRSARDGRMVLVQPDTLDLPEPQEGELTEHYARMMRYHSRIDGNIPDRSVIFIGDSITQGLAVSAVATPSVNYGIGSDTAVGVLHRIPEYRSIHRSRAVVIAIGINDMRRRSDQEILAHIQRIPTLIPESVPILFSAVLPLDETNREQWAGWNENRIQPLNEAIREWASQHDRLYVVNAGPDLVNADGNLAAAYHIGDGIHLSSEGNAVWIRTLRSSLNEIAPQ